MKKRISTKGVLFIILSLAIVLLLFFGQSTFSNMYKDSNSFMKSFFDRSFNYDRLSSLEMENQSLKFELEKLQENNSLNNNPDVIEALVYSSYPYSGKENIVINVGDEDGIEAGMPVLSNGFLIGSISDVSNNQSSVQTIFDTEWSSSIGIGDYSNKAVLEGGNQPSLDLIPQDVDFEVGADVFNLSSDFPIYQIIGTVDSIDEEDGDIWQSGKLSVPYELNEIKTVEVLINFP